MKILPSFKQFPVLVLSHLSIPAWAANTSAVEAAGIPNFHQVNEHIYRAGQPTDHGWTSLASRGVKTGISLRREDHDSADAVKQAVEGAGMRYTNVPVNAIVGAKEEDIAKVRAV